MRGAIVVALAVATLSCGALSRPALVPPPACPDGAPVRWLQHPSCGRVCGFSCLPDRWRGVDGVSRAG